MTLIDQPETEPAEIILSRLLLPTAPIKVATAESCTGGGVASRIVSVSGCSEYMMGSIVSYSNDAKHRLLGVPEEILNTVGAVSPECAEAMATGARRAFRTEVAVSTTGIAGPGGATARKPVGLVYFGLATPAGVSSYEHHFSGDRAAVIAAATETAMQLLLRGVRETLAG